MLVRVEERECSCLQRKRQEGREHWLNCGLPAVAAAATPDGNLVGENSWALFRPTSSYLDPEACENSKDLDSCSVYSTTDQAVLTNPVKSLEITDWKIPLMILPSHGCPHPMGAPLLTCMFRLIYHLWECVITSWSWYLVLGLLMSCINTLLLLIIPCSYRYTVCSTKAQRPAFHCRRPRKGRVQKCRQCGRQRVFFFLMQKG